MTNKKRGRPVFKVTTQLKYKVAVGAGGGMSHVELALALGISRETLEKHFEHELTYGAYERRLEALLALHRVAKKGNVAAVKAYTLLSPYFIPPPGAAEPPGPQVQKPDAETKDQKPEKTAAEKPLGKKQQANVDAVNAGEGDEWGTLLNRRHPNTQIQ